jgi:hypothetical protein
MRCTSFLFILGFTTISAASEVASDLAPRAQAAIAETFGALSQNLMKALQEGGVRQAVPFCQKNAAGLVKPIAEKHGLRIQRVSHKARNPANRATDAELALIQTFTQAIAEGRPLTPKVVPQPDGAQVFYAPILIPADACLKCHGIPGDTMSTADHDFIRTLYPEDAATGFNLGDLRGLWKLTFPKS